jgi:predicted ester cyclase
VSPEELAQLHFDAVASGNAASAYRVIHPEHVNHMAAEEPPACRLVGVPGLMATSAWLRSAFTGLRFDVIEMVSADDRTIAHVWMRGTQTGPFVIFPDGKPVAFAPTRREIAVRQCHIFRLRDGMHAEHISVRDDLGMMTQLGHLPPNAAAIARMARWTLSGRAKRAAAAAVALSNTAAHEVTRPSRQDA